ncbi:MAG: hypothetical protein M3487_02505, partial [Actinomycetota bacterium]|nr:hypothetical protein [Actinomycetota bacterium]
GDDPAALAPSADSEGPPARPAKASALPSPLLDFMKPRPRVLTLAVALWILSGLCGFLIIGYFIFHLGGVRALLETTMRAEDPDVDGAALKTAINGTIAISLGLIGLFAESVLLLALLMAGRRNWARGLLAIVGVVTLPVTAVGATLLTVGAIESRVWLLLAIIAQQVFMVAGMVTMFLPAPNAWFRLRLRQ